MASRPYRVLPFSVFLTVVLVGVLLAPWARRTAVVTSSSWTYTANKLQVGRYNVHATTLQDARVLLFEPTSGTGTRTGYINGPRTRHTATLLPNGKVLATGGDRGSSRSPSTALLARLTTLSRLSVLLRMGLPAQGVQAQSSPGWMMMASGHSHAHATQTPTATTQPMATATTQPTATATVQPTSSLTPAATTTVLPTATVTPTAAGCAAPYLHTSGSQTGKFGVAVRTGGAQQLTFDRAPLYTFVKDTKPGAMTGQGFDVAGGYWWAVTVGGGS